MCYLSVCLQSFLCKMRGSETVMLNFLFPWWHLNAACPANKMDLIITGIKYIQLLRILSRCRVFSIINSWVHTVACCLNSQLHTSQFPWQSINELKLKSRAVAFAYVIHCIHTQIPSYLLMVLYEDLYHNILELDVHDGRHRLLLWAKQSWPKNHAQIGDGHQVLLVMTGHTVEGGLEESKRVAFTNITTPLWNNTVLQHIKYLLKWPSTLINTLSRTVLKKTETYVRKLRLPALIQIV